jgi:hypothetical protein
MEVALEFAGGGEGLHHELHGGQQFAGARVAGNEVHRGERTVVDAQGELVAVQDFEDVENVLVAADEAEHLGDVHGVARPRVREQFAGLRALERVEAAGCARLFLEHPRVADLGLGENEVLPGGRLLVGRHPFVDEIGHAVPRFRRRIGPRVASHPVASRHRIPLDPSRRQALKSLGSLDAHRTRPHPIVCRQASLP